MGYSFTLDDVAFLCSPAGQEALRFASVLPLTDHSRLSDVDILRRSVPRDHVGAVLETAVLRRRAKYKVDGSDGWLFTDAALQQASATAVGKHRAQRLAGRDVHDVTCSIGVDLAAIAAVARRAVGSDLDPVRLAMAAHNLRDHHVALVRADALQPVTRGTVIFADPSRRDSAGRRRWRPADFAPPLDDLATVYSGRPLVAKCAPGMDFNLAPWADEVEVVSLDGEVREASLWAGDLATPGVHRRATVLSTNRRMWTVTDQDPDDCPVRSVGQWLVNPDGAVVRTGLVRQYGARHALGLLDPRIAYLTGDQPPPGVRSFRVLEYGHYTEKALRAGLRRLNVGAAEILVRGLNVDPNALRPRLKLRGEQSITVVLAKVGHTPMAFICRAERS
jgi:hypothetical protein